MRDNRKPYIIMQCMMCGQLEIYPSQLPDGNRCSKCNGGLKPLGYASMGKHVNISMRQGDRRRREDKINLELKVQDKKIKIEIE